MAKYTNDGRPIEKGRLVTALQDFKAHIDGTGWRQDASTIDMAPSLPGFSGTHVQKTLEQLQSLITSNGSGFVSIGSTLDGYYGSDGYAIGEYNVGSIAAPTFFDAFNLAVKDHRLINGGIIFILQGYYHATTTISVPAGISVMGELSGTVIIGETTEFPIFKILKGKKVTPIGGNSGSGDINLVEGAPVDETKFFNLIIADNLRGKITSSGNEIASMQTVPMIMCEISSKFTCEDVKFIGRVNGGSISGRGKTLRAIGYTEGSNTATYLTLKRCFFDGMASAVDFQPGNGLIDNLLVDSCRARTFGTESGVLDPDKNCFVSMSACNAQLTNNYHVGVNNGVNSTVYGCFIVTTETGSYDTKIIVSGNTGGPSFVTDRAKVFLQAGDLTLKSIQSGNSWGSTVQNPWFVTVGNNTADSNLTSGDFAGIGAIDLLLDASFKYPTTVIVNPGTYTVTKQDASNYNFIGNSIQNDYPIFNLQIASSGTDTVGNRFFKVGTKIKGIKFVTPAAFHFTSVRTASKVGTDSFRTTEVIDCIFKDSALMLQASGVPSDDLFQILIKNCQFKQTGAYANNIMLLLPNATSITLEDCTFKGGLIGGIGDNGTLSYVSGVQETSNYTLKNCIMSLVGSSITVLPTGITSYFYINNASARVLVDNCLVLCDANFVPATPIAGGLAATFTKFINITAREIIIDNTTVNGPTQTFTSGGNIRPLPSLFLTGTQSCRVINSRFLEGGLPLQIGGASCFTDLKYRDALIVSNNEFACNTGQIAMTMIDVDLSLTTPGTIVSQILISNNNIINVNSGTVMRPALHSNASGSYYNAIGAIQVYAHFFDVKISNNNISLNKMSMPSPALGISHLSGLVVNNWDSTVNAGTGFFTTNIIGNTIRVVNNFASATASESASCMWIKSSHLKMSDNIVNMQSPVALSTSDVLCLYVSNTPNTGSVSEGMINNNLFSRLNTTTNLLTELNTGYIYIASGTGIILNNTFDSPQQNLSAFVCINDSTSNWIIEHNKNHTSSKTLTAQNGRFSAGSSIYVFGDKSALSPNTQANGIAVVYSAATLQVITFLYNDAGSEHDAGWFINLNEVLPMNVYISSVTVQMSSTDFDTTCSWRATLRSTGQSNVVSGPTTITSTPAFLTCTTANTNYRIDATHNTTFAVTGTMNDLGSPRSANILTMAVVYTWR